MLNGFSGKELCLVLAIRTQQLNINSVHFKSFRLSITSPVERLDAGEYQCEASNVYGTVFSDIANVTFGGTSQYYIIIFYSVLCHRALAVLKINLKKLIPGELTLLLYLEVIKHQ